MPIVVDPNPSTNPGLRLRCANCKGQGINTEWDWHFPVDPSSSTGYTTEIGTPETYDSLYVADSEYNSKYPHCPVCESPAVDVIAVYDPTT